ncbi:helix-turn-helix domain-containing protein [Mycolicibacterium sp. 050158]|jgi:transcriptional regulator with XRE-family HTH domain|uniref:helix-turn-helix domain-containing protein n=1 Tax=Mycolicibacterium sp. 050158 TaxID=3090602 RepID=UPI00299D904A|nr:helix-turn-helix domain-containing protein [Mycolicibacterium sp. 050158]MDX1891725.1 helix-turn-helix domain-containing protein [Mycolicibacterium sp. 050158]
MSDELTGSVFADRLNRLFDTVHPPGGPPHTSAEVVTALQSYGVKVSAPYMSQLRLGRRTNPSATTMAALAEFFRVDVRYFTDDQYYAKLSKELALLASLRDTGVRRLASRVVGLSHESLHDLISAAEGLRRREGLDP